MLTARNILIFLLLLNFSFAKDFDLPEDFLNAFNTYKTSHINKDAKTYYNKVLMPYFRYLNSYEDFEHYLKAYETTEDIIITNVLSKNEENIKIVIGIKLKKIKDMLYSEQNWFKVNGKFYLLLDEFLIFKK